MPHERHQSIELVVIIVVVLLLLAVGDVLFLVCVLGARASRREGREDGERVYDTVQEREVIGTVRNQAYGHVGQGKGTEMVRVDATEMEETKGADREYDPIQEREVIETERNEAYGHFDGGGRRKEHSTEDLEYEEI